MNLDELAKFIIQREEQLRKGLEERAETLSLQEILKEIKFEPRACEYEDFKEGDTLQFNIGKTYGRPCPFYHVNLYRGVLVLETFGPARIITSFKGRKVDNYYKKLSAAIIKAQEEGAHQLPF
jgi:hypothetical protein